MYGCDSCKYLRHKLGEIRRENDHLHIMRASLEATRREYADYCEGYNMPVCVGTCPAYPACRALEAARPKKTTRRKKVYGDRDRQA